LIETHGSRAGIDAKKNQTIFISRWFDRHGLRWRRREEVGDDWLKDGLASLEFSVISPLRSFPHEASSRAQIDKVVVDFPSP
jgi:hypothetical protein